MGVLGAIDGLTFVVMATATVIGEVACAVTVVGVAGETSTRRAALLMLGSWDGSDFGGGLSP